MKKIYCKDCIHYLGQQTFSIDYPMKPSTTWKYWCKLLNGSVFKLNRENNCLSFKPTKGLKKFIRQLNIFRYG